MNKQAIRAIALKDMRSVTANFQVWGPMIILPLLFVVVLPAALMLGLRYGGDLSQSTQMSDLVKMLDTVGPVMAGSKLDAFTTVNQKLAYIVTNYLFAPFFLLIPLMSATTVSAQSFAGEKERGTLESILFAPVDALSLYMGKILAALIPAVGLSFISFLIYGVVVNTLGWPMFGRLFFPDLNWLPLMLLVIPMISLGAILFSVYVSSRVATFQAAYQMSGLVVLPSHCAHGRPDGRPAGAGYHGARLGRAGAACHQRHPHSDDGEQAGPGHSLRKPGALDDRHCGCSRRPDRRQRDRGAAGQARVPRRHPG